MTDREEFEAWWAREAGINDLLATHEKAISWATWQAARADCDVVIAGLKAECERLNMAIDARAAPAQDTVPMPTNREQAEMMVRLGSMWLEQHWAGDPVGVIGTVAAPAQGTVVVSVEPITGPNYEAGLWSSVRPLMGLAARVAGAVQVRSYPDEMKQGSFTPNNNRRP